MAQGEAGRQSFVSKNVARRDRPRLRPISDARPKNLGGDSKRSASGVMADRKEAVYHA